MGARRRRTRWVRRGVRAFGAAVATVVVLALALGLLGTPYGAVAVTTELTESATALEPTTDPAADAAEATAPAPADSIAAGPSVAAADADAAGTTPPPAENAHSPPAAESATQAFAASGGISLLAGGVPEAGVPVWTETFEQGLGTAPVGISAYPAAGGARYSAAAFWQNAANCTGVLAPYDASFPANNTVCSTLLGLSTLPQRQVRRMADVLGQVATGTAGGATTPVNGSTATTRTNHALAATTSAGSNTANQIVLESIAALGVAATGSRYYVLSLDMAGDECTTNAAQLDAYLVVGSAARALTAAPLSACALPGSLYTSPTIDAITWATSVKGGRLTSDTGVLLTAAEAASTRLRVTNRTSLAAGNVFAIDNLRLWDATPSLDMEFSPGSVVAGTASTLTFTVTNTTDLAAKPDWSFTNALPAGLTVAPAPAVAGTCANVTGTAFAVTAAAGGSSVAVTGGDLAAGAASCTITVNVLSTTPGTYANGAGNVTTPLVAPETATLTVTPASTVTVRKNITSRVGAADQFTLSLRSGTTVLASATTAGTATGVQSAEITRYIVQPSATYTIHETPVSGAGLAYAPSYECVRGTTVVAAGANASGSLTIPAEQGVEIVCTFTNSPQAVRLACDTNHMYSLTPTGGLVQGDIVSGATAAVGSWSGAASANALGVGAGGSIAYALERSADSTDVASILKWTPGGGFQTLAGTAYTTVAGGTTIDGSVVAGAIDLSGTRYYFGKFVNSQFYLWSFTETNPAASRFAFVGSFPTGSAPNGNGDMAFDARGNLYVVGAATVNNASSAAVYTITAQTLAGAPGGTLTVSASTTKPLVGADASPAFSNVNGIAFTPRGTAYLSSTTSVYEFDVTTWTRVAGTPRIAVDSTDLAGCTSPATVTVLKYAVGRAAAADQFTLTLANGATTVATATTSGALTGRQAQQIGPVPATVGSTLTVSEAMATGSTSVITVYTTVYECWADGIRLSNGSARSGTVTIPDRLNVNVVCTFFNSPRPASTVTITKQVLDPVTGAAQPAAGWTLGTAATATAGTATVLPSEAPTQRSDAAGTAVWSVMFGSTASRATLTISEEQRTGYVLERATCTVNGTLRSVTFSAGGGVVQGSITGVESASTIACTLVNRPVAALTLVKNVAFGSALATDWMLRATGPAGALAGPAGRSGSVQASAVAVTPSVPYRLTETGGALTYVQSGAWQCADAGGQAIAVSGAGDVTLPVGANATCTVTNATAAITLLVQVQDPQPGFRPVDWTVTATPGILPGAVLPTQSRSGADYSASGNALNTFEVRPGHEYTFEQRVTVGGSRLAYRALRLERLDAGVWTPVASASITSPGPGQTATYRFVNAPVEPTVLPVTGGPSADGFTIGGSIVLALALALALFHRRRRRRRVP